MGMVNLPAERRVILNRDTARLGPILTNDCINCNLTAKPRKPAFKIKQYREISSLYNSGGNAGIELEFCFIDGLTLSNETGHGQHSENH